MKLGPDALVLCGGRSRRLGHDKAFTPIGGMPIIARILSALSPVAGTIRLLADESEKFATLPYEVLVDRVPYDGPVAAIAPALSSVRSEYVFIVSCDMPFLTSDYFQLLATTIDEADVCLPMADGRLMPLAALYHQRVASVFAAHADAGRRRLMDVIGELDPHVLHTADLIGFADKLLLNVNTPDDARAAKEAT